MKKILTTISEATILLTAVFAIGILLSSVANTHATDQSSEAAEAKATETAEVNNDGYTYTAQPGDSYIQMARKAVQTYGIETDTQIGAAGVLFAETNLTSLAGWPALSEGQTVAISRADVKEWFNKAAELTADEKAAWEYYAPFVNFSTNHVGEASRD